MRLFVHVCFIMCSMFSLSSLADSDYRAPFWQLNGHLQTIAPYLSPPTPAQTYQRERWELDDGDFVDVDWTELPQADISVQAQQRPVFILFHGLEGNSQSHYARSLIAEAKKQGWLGVVIHFRGCSGEPNRLPRVYYAGDAIEISTLVQRVRKQRPHSPLFAAGVSLGGNALLKWLGEYPEQSRQWLTAAAAISAPIALKETAHSLDTGLNYWLYSQTFVASMKPKALAMAERFPTHLDKQRIQAVKTVQDMDNAVTAVLYGAQSADHYYDLNASKPWLAHIQTSTLILNAQNDPFVPFESLPDATQVSAAVTLDYPKHGGHAGFSGKASNGQSTWLAARVFEFLNTQQRASLNAD